MTEIVTTNGEPWASSSQIISDLQSKGTIPGPTPAPTRRRQRIMAAVEGVLLGLAGIGAALIVIELLRMS